eukprot:scaffold19167_cov111-Isochrysis_galbana.AAC.2
MVVGGAENLDELVEANMAVGVGIGRGEDGLDDRVQARLGVGASGRKEPQARQDGAQLRGVYLTVAALREGGREWKRRCIGLALGKERLVAGQKRGPSGTGIVGDGSRKSGRAVQAPAPHAAVRIGRAWRTPLSAPGAPRKRKHACCNCSGPRLLCQAGTHPSESKKSKARRSAVAEDIYSGDAQAQNSLKSMRPSASASSAWSICSASASHAPSDRIAADSSA